VVTIGGWLLVVGLCDLMRAAHDATTAGRRSLIVTTGLVLFGVHLATLELSGAEWLWVGLVPAAGLVLWILASSIALQMGPSAATGVRATAFAGLAGGLMVTLFAGGMVGVGPELPSRLGGSLLAGVSLDRAVFVVGAVFVQLSTANVVVRLVLDSVGVPATTNEKQLKGGRLLGPMERLFIVGLGVAGQFTAAAVVVAAKGILRFPELQRSVADSEVGPDGPSDVTEYFLIGSFASWLIALGAVGLLAL
jgi:hypothetical protein